MLLHSAYRRGDSLILVPSDRGDVIWMDESAAVVWSRFQAAVVIRYGRLHGRPWSRVTEAMLEQAEAIAVADDDDAWLSTFPVFDGRGSVPD
jgi:hypothetical protein